MKIELQKLRFLNFKGIRDLEVNFSQSTKIWGDNATGKTTIPDGFCWLLFGKNLEDKSWQNFSIKTLDSKGDVIPQVNHEVEGTLLIDGETLVLKRVLKEKWQKKHGEVERKHTGDTEEFFINEVPKSKGEYQLYIASLIKEDQFKLITNPLYFNSVMDWKMRRTMLFKMADITSFADIAATRKEFGPLLDIITKKSIAGYKDELKSKIKKIKDQLKDIPARIDEASRDMPEMPDTKAIDLRLSVMQEEIDGIDGNLEAINSANAGKRGRIQLLNGEILELRSKINIIKSHCNDEAFNLNAEAAKTLVSLKSDKETKELRLNRLNGSIDEITNDILKLELRAQSLRDDFIGIQSKSIDFSTVKTECPACNRPFPEGDIEEEKEKIRANINQERASSLNKIQEEGVGIKPKIIDLEKTRDGLADERAELENDISKIDTAIKIEEGKPKEHVSGDKLFSENKESAKLNQQIEEKEKEIQNITMNTADDTETQERKSSIISEMDTLKLSLGNVKIIEQKQARVKQLNEEGQRYSQEIADLEREEYLVQEFNKAYISGIEQSINLMFTTVNFRMFEGQINGGEKDDCTMLMNGVPWSDLNSAGKIQAGIEVINVISAHFGYLAPIFIDNSESIVQTPETNTQLIQLIVSGKDKKLRIE
jgi:DNA repair exonuclease SbcCD ATPase subunit